MAAAAGGLPDLNTAEGRAEAIKRLDPDFHGVLERKEVSEQHQALLSNLGVKSVSKFAVIAEATADVRQFAVDQMQVDRARDMVAVAGIVDAWNACKTRMETRHKAEAEALSSACHRL
eukprot:s841_g15.t1